MIEIEIDGKKVSAEQGQMVIDVADKNGMYIPRFCYHKKLSIAANCRMCLVEVERSGKPLPACATPVTDGMVVHTKSKKAMDAQRIVMEFLLINHPLDCPICDQGGECELQDLALGYGDDISRFTEGKRAVEDEDLGPLIATEMTRCIHCTRCVRFGTEIAGMPEIGMTGRGEKARIGTYIKNAVKSEVSGNIIDLCPVGALTNKPFRYSARSWEMKQHPTIAPHDCLGSNLYLHTRGYEYTNFREVMRAVPRENEALNETWISDRDRYSYQAISHTERLTQPLIRKDGEWTQVDWATALDFTVAGLRSVLDNQGPDQIGAITSPSATLEEMYLLQKLMRSIGVANIDHRIRQSDFSGQHHLPSFPSLGVNIAELSSLDTVLLVGSNVKQEQPIAGLRLRHAFKEGAQMMAINCVDYDFHFDQAHKAIVQHDQLLNSLTGVLKAVVSHQKVTINDKFSDALAVAVPTDIELAIAEQLIAGKQSAILLGAVAEQHPKAHSIFAIATELAKLTGATCGQLSLGANAAGAWLAGAIPHRGPAATKVEKIGLHAQAMFKEALSAYVLLNIEPEADGLNPAQNFHALQEAFVVCLSPFVDEATKVYADVILPVGTFAETDGTFVNAEGTWQSFSAVTPPFAQARPAWKVLRVLGNLFEATGFDYVCSSEIREECAALVNSMKTSTPGNITIAKLNPASDQLTSMLHWPAYSTDNLLRRATALQATQVEELAIKLNAKTATSLGLKAGEKIIAKQQEQSVTLPLVIDQRLTDNLVQIPAGFAETRGFGQSFAAITLQQGK